MFFDWRLRAFTIAGMIGLTLIVITYQNTQDSVSSWLSTLSVSQQELNWKATSLVREHLRFVVSLDDYVNQSDDSTSDIDALFERFEVYWSRYTTIDSLFKGFDEKTLKLLINIDSVPDSLEEHANEILAILIDIGIPTLSRIEPILTELEPGDSNAFNQIMSELQPLANNVVLLETALFERTRLFQFSHDYLTRKLNSQLSIAYIGLCVVIFVLVVAIYAYVVIKNRASRSLETVNNKLLSKISESEELTRELKRLATHDSLTDLLNRHGFEVEIDTLFQNSHQMHGLCFVDLDMFKIVNDTSGHAAGDRLIQEVAQLLLSEFESYGYVARFGGDEFVLVWPNCKAEEFKELIVEVSEKLQPFRFQADQQQFDITASFGALHFHASEHSKESILALADVACYQAKNSGGGRVHFHNGDDSIIASRKSDLFWINAIQQALKEDRFVLFQQPIVEICQEGIGQHSWELLIRMRNEEGGLSPPGLFLDVAERYGMAPRIDRWVVQHAFDWLNRHSLDSIGLDCLNINLSGLSVSDLEFLSFIEEQTSQANFAPQRVCFELTETAVAGHQSREFLHRLKALGYQLALDDFGSGFASFGYLESLPVDYIKIDGQFVKDVDTSSMHREFVKAIGTIGQAMNKKVVAEFVENEASLNVLRELQIDFAQGYHIAKPAQLSENPETQANLPRAA